jgi:hypothetical protein
MAQVGAEYAGAAFGTQRHDSMNRVLTDEIWQEVKAWARRARVRNAAIAYVTQDLIGLRHGDTLITDASEHSIRSGQTDAPLLLNLCQSGVIIHSHRGLHSKVISFGKHVIVGSANMSGAELIEASIVTDNPQITSGIASFIAQLSTPKSELTCDQIQKLCKIKVVRTGWRNVKRPTRVRRLGATTWIVGVKELGEPSEVERGHIDRANSDLNKRHRTSDREYDWIRWSKKGKFPEECREGDTLIQIFNPRGTGRRVVTRRLPVLLKRAEPRFTRFYIDDAPRMTDEISWSRFQRILKAVGHKRQVRPLSVQALDPAVADAIDRKWTRIR